ncbi:hypothetical protein IFM89_022604, partial [Coptis chinensis]
HFVVLPFRQICYFFYKNVAFGVTVFLFEAYTSFSGQAAYNDWYLSFYNVLFTALPTLALGVLDQDVSTRFCIKFPLLYQEGVQNVLLSWRRILGWMFNGLTMSPLHLLTWPFANVVRLLAWIFWEPQCIPCVVWVVNVQMAISLSYFTLIQHIVIWGSVFNWYLFSFAYGSMPPNLSTNAYKVFLIACSPAPSYWLLVLFVVIAAVIPYYSYTAITMRFFPMYHQMIQWIRQEGQSNDPEYCNMVHQRCIRPTTVGFTARAEARSRSQRK